MRNVNVKYIVKALKNYQLNHFNFRMILYVVILTTIGYLTIGSATDPADGYQSKQLLGITIAVAFMLVATIISYKFIFMFYWLIYALNAVLLLAVMVFGDSHLGAKRWITVTSSINIQPSEFTKVLMTIFIAAFIQKNYERMNSFRFLITIAILTAFPLFLIFKQPDLSTTIVLFSAFSLMIFLSGLDIRIVLGILLFAIPIGAVVIYLIFTLPPDKNIIKEYQYNRIVRFFQSEEERDNDTQRLMYQQENSVLAIGSGGLTGKGLNNNTITSVKNGNFLSEPHTDFIFTIIGEEMGFIGCASVLLLIILICFECFLVGGHACDLQGKVFAYGFGCLIAVQTIVNVSVVTMLIPNTGLTLPFISYGLCSLISMYSGIGVILNIGMQRTKNIYEEVKM